MLAVGATAWGIPAGIHIHGTAPENVVNIRPQANTAQPALGSIPEGASPDYNCFTYGQVIGGVPIWFSVNYNGVTGYYASYYDDSSYSSDAELTNKYGVPKCGAVAPAPPPTPPPPAPQPPAPPMPVAPSQPPAAPAPSEATQSLPIDPAFWCTGTGERGFATEIREGGVKIYYEGLSGDTDQNNWRCRWSWSRNGRTVWVPRHRYVNIDFKQACQEQFPGTKLHYTTQASTPWPWECLGVAGKYYPPPSIRLSSLERDSGYSARNIRSRATGTLSLRMSASTGSVRAARVSPHRITIGRGFRRVASGGSYTVRVRLTREGRAYLRGRKLARVTFTLRLPAKDGKDQNSSTTRLIRR